MIRRIFLLLPLLGVLFSTCKKDLEIDDTDKNFPVSLRITGTGDNLVFEWDEAPSSTFERYILVRSFDSIPTGLPANGAGAIIVNTDQRDSVRVSNLTHPFVNKLYFKLYVDIGERPIDGVPSGLSRFVESATVPVQLNNFVINGNPTQVRFLPERNWVFIANNSPSSSNSELMLVDYTTNQVVSTRANVPIADPNYMGVDIGKNQNNELELYWWGANSEFVRYGLPDFTEKQSISSTFTGFSLVTNEAGQFMTTQYDFDRGFAVRNFNNFSIQEGEYRPNYYEHRTLLMLDKAENRVVEAGPYSLRIFTVDPASGQASNTVSVNTTTYPVFLNDMPVSQDRQYFIPHRDGRIYDRQLSNVAQIPDPFGVGIADASFAPDGQRIFVISTDPFSFNSTHIRQFSFPNMELLTEQFISNILPSRLRAIANNQIVFVGNSVNGLNQFAIKKITF
jgi:hypothetical protein